MAEIAYRFGFKDASHFNRVFKAGFGATPARFRRQGAIVQAAVHAKA